MKPRPLNAEEHKLLEIWESFHRNRIRRPFPWMTLVIWLLVIGGSFLFIYFITSTWIRFSAQFAVAIIPVGLWLWIAGWRSDKRASRKMLEDVTAVRKTGTINVSTYSCQRAILFEDFADLGTCFALEIAPDSLLFWWADYDGEQYLLPSTNFEVYQEDHPLISITGNRLIITGSRFQPVKINSEISQEIWDELPRHGEIIAGNVDCYLDKISGFLQE